jgi:hypothetical protein
MVASMVAVPPGRTGRGKEMHLPRRDIIATGLVAVAGLLYLL